MIDSSGSDEKSTERKRAILEVERALRQKTDAPFERLDSFTLRSTYATRHFTNGWRIPVIFSDSVTRHVDLLACSLFPIRPVRAALVDRPDYLTWPHIEHDGILCLLPNSSEVDPDNPEQVALNILNRSANLVEELIEGKIVDRDFREEFLTYWFYGASDIAKDVVTLFAPEPPSRALRMFRHSELIYVAEDEVSLTNWIARRFGRKLADKVTKQSIPAAFIWLDQPLVPSEYPKLGSDISSIATEQGETAVSAITAAASHDDKICLVLFGAEGRGGAGLMPVQINREIQHRAINRRIKDPLHAGFRRGKIPIKIKFTKTFSDNKVRRSQVARADAQWVHGRGKDPRSAILGKKSVTIFGCGSVGSFVAEHLARSGTGTINIVDYDKLVWANVGRHALGASSIDKNKALELAEKLQGEFPHLKVMGYDACAISILDDDPNGLLDADLILSVMGNWAAESILNRWHQQTDRKKPVIYGWTENHAMAGSAVIISNTGGCLGCGITRTGSPIETATVWPDETELSTEPSCADHYQPYGAIELSFVTSLIANATLDEFLSPSAESYRKVWISSKQRLSGLGGELSPYVIKLLGNNAQCEQVVCFPWKIRNCPVCGSTSRSGMISSLV